MNEHELTELASARPADADGGGEVTSSLHGGGGGGGGGAGAAARSSTLRMQAQGDVDAAQAT